MPKPNVNFDQLRQNAQGSAAQSAFGPSVAQSSEPFVNAIKGAFDDQKYSLVQKRTKEFMEMLKEVAEKEKELAEEKISNARDTIDSAKEEIAIEKKKLAGLEIELSLLKKVDNVRREQLKNERAHTKSIIANKNHLISSSEAEIRATRRNSQETFRHYEKVKRNIADVENATKRAQRLKQDHGILNNVLTARSIRSGLRSAGHNRIGRGIGIFQGVEEGTTGEAVTGLASGAAALAGAALAGAVISEVTQLISRSYKNTVNAADVYLGTNRLGTNESFLSDLTSVAKGKRMSPDEAIEYAGAIRSQGGSMVSDMTSLVSYGAGMDRATGAKLGTFGQTMGYIARNSSFSGSALDNKNFMSEFASTMGRGGLMGLQEETLQALKELVDLTKQTNVNGGNAGELIKLIGDVSEGAPKGLKGIGAANALATISQAIASPTNPWGQVIAFRALQKTYREAGSPLANNTGYLVSAESQGAFQVFKGKHDKSERSYANEMYKNFIGSAISMVGGISDKDIETRSQKYEGLVNAFSETTHMAPQFAEYFIKNRGALFGKNGDGGIISEFGKSLPDNLASDPSVLSFESLYAENHRDLGKTEEAYINSFQDETKRERLKNLFADVKGTDDEKKKSIASIVAKEGTSDAVNAANILQDLENNFMGWFQDAIKSIEKDVDNIANVMNLGTEAENPYTNPNDVPFAGTMSEHKNGSGQREFINGTPDKRSQTELDDIIDHHLNNDHGVDHTLLKTLQRIESGDNIVNEKTWNKNGTFDTFMGINSSHFAKGATVDGFDEYQLSKSPEKAIQASASIMHAIQSSGIKDIRQALGAYHGGQVGLDIMQGVKYDPKLRKENQWELTDAGRIKEVHGYVEKAIQVYNEIKSKDKSPSESNKTDINLSVNLHNGNGGTTRYSKKIRNVNDWKNATSAFEVFPSNRAF